VVAQSTGQPVTQNAVTGNAVQQTTQVPVGGTTETVSEERPAALSTVKSKDFDSLGYFKQKAEDEKAKLRERTFAKIKADSLDSNAYNGLGLIQDDSENYNYSMPNQGWNNALRYAPVIANLGLLAYNIFDKPEQFKYNRVGASTITQRMAYNPIDSEYIANQIRQQAAGTNRALIDNSGGNRGIATSLIMAANRQSQNAIGDALMKGTIMNRELEEKAKAFNRQTDTTNAQLSLDAQKTNAQIDMQEQQANAASRAAKRNAINQGIVNLGNALGKIGTENRWGDLAPAMTGYDQYAKYQKAQSEINAAKQRKEAETKAKKEAIKFEKEKLKKAADDKKAIEKRKKAAEAKKKADEDAKSKVRYFDTNTKTWRYR
jgi:hypothetical protein